MTCRQQRRFTKEELWTDSWYVPLHFVISNPSSFFKDSFLVLFFFFHFFFQDNCHECGAVRGARLLNIGLSRRESGSAPQLGRHRGHRHKLAQSGMHSGAQGSPYPMIDRFIASLVETGSAGTGKIRSWLLSSSSKTSSLVAPLDHTQTEIVSSVPPNERITLTYQATNCHWCENVGRAHKSNHIYWVVDIGHGTYCQRCHDPECRHFSSAPRSLPQDCVVSKEPVGDVRQITCYVT